MPTVISPSEQRWRDVLFQFGMDRYKTEVEAIAFSIRGVQIFRNWKYVGLNTDAILTAILDWVCESEEAEIIVPQLHRILEEEGLITAEGELLRPE